MEFRRKKEITDGTKKQGLSRLNIGLDANKFNRLRIIAMKKDTFASEIIRVLIDGFLKDYDDNGNPINEETDK
jgi:hypothetical protein